jgi:hypothetical protein
MRVDRRRNCQEHPALAVLAKPGGHAMSASGEHTKEREINRALCFVAINDKLDENDTAERGR